jgi:hypothetical protein
MDFMVGGYLSKDGTQILLFSASVCVARVACEDIRQEFGVRLSNEDLLQLASVREVNKRTLSEIANSLFEAGQDTLIDVYHVVDIKRSHLAARKKEFAWGQYDIPDVLGIPKPSKVRFTKFELESDIVDRMLRSLGCRDYFLCDPNAGQKTESGADVLTKLDGSLIGFQVTQYHSDVDAVTGGSSVRREGSRKAARGLRAPAFIKPISIPALVRLLGEKSQKGWSQKDFPDMRLVIAASVPQDGALVATFLFEPRLNVNEMNAQLSPILEQTEYVAAYLYIMMPEAVYGWTKESGWEKLS